MPGSDGGAIFVLSRRVKGDNGEVAMQNVTVYANNADEARAIVNDQFARLRRVSRSPETPYLPTPAFSIETIALDRPKMITAGLTVS